MYTNQAVNAKGSKSSSLYFFIIVHIGKLAIHLLLITLKSIPGTNQYQADKGKISWLKYTTRPFNRSRNDPLQV